jgi:transposase
LQFAGDVRVYRRTLALLELDRGRSAREVAESLGVARETVQRWAARLRGPGSPSDLADAPRPGRPPLLGGEALDFLWSVLKRTPQDLALPHTSWTVPLLCRVVAIATGLEPSGDTVRRVLSDWGYAWKRPRYVLAPDPEREKKNAASSGKSPHSRPAASSSARTRPTSCCSRPCGPAGRGAASPPRCC